MAGLRMDTEQMDLLSWEPPRTVIVFPLTARIGRIRNVAEKLSRKQGRAADAYWRQTVTTLAGQMDRAGIPQETIDAELRAFFDAVQRELVRLTYRNERPGGAA